MSQQQLEKNHPDYHIFPYGIWLPFNNPQLIEKIKNYIQIHVESDEYTMMYFNGYRVRTPTDSGSHPCYNCGHCIDNGYSSCGNRKCVKDRKNRKLCDGQHWRGRGKTWIHNIEKDYVFKNIKKGVVYNWTKCKECNLSINWLGDYLQEEHIKNYFRYLKGLKPIEYHINNESLKQKTSRSIPGKLRHILFVKFNYKCVECGATKDETTLEIDHKIPWSKGGLTELDNLQVLCKKCNRAKHTRIWMDDQ